jgi:hypothetical protein
VHVSINVYIRDTHNRVVELELTHGSTVWWATVRALIALDDPGDAAEYALALHGKPLPPYRSLAASNVRNGDTLDLLPARAIGRRPSRISRLVHKLPFR